MRLRPQYLEDGFHTPLTIFTPEKAAALYSSYQDYVARYGTDGKLEGDLRFRLHVVAKWARDIVFAPNLVAAVKDVLDTDHLLCWDSDLNIKPPGTQSFYSWHQDGTYSGHSPASGVLTAWIALSPAPTAAGCLLFRPGSHLSQLPHLETQDPSNLLAVGQTIPEDHILTLNKPVAAPLAPGQASLHHWNCVHASGPNTTEHERVGLAVRYIRTDVHSSARGGVKECVTLVSGEYTGDEWELEEDLEEEYGDEEWESHRKGAEREKSNYFTGTGAEGFK
eukprot:GFUD01010441.1.p1 GENE.GFUD01010441.1~~GFUD01010441.1.p1  ORF type:complete len:295 (+),score=69.63 GFUD01010441.1:50-886(+)